MRQRTFVVVGAVVVILVVAGVARTWLDRASPATTDRVSAVVSAQTTKPPGDIDSLLAPIALYPDQLLAQILLCATDPASVTKLDGWLRANQSLKGSALQDQAVLAGFEPSFVALSLFPQVVRSMAEKLEWTTLIGQVFSADKSAVFASIQKLRAQASAAGTLKSTPQQQVGTETTSSGQQVIVIEPTNPQVVYVPQYNPSVVYAPTTTTSTVVVESGSSADAAAAGALVGFTAGIVIGAAVNDHYYYGPYGWHGGAYMYDDAWDDYYDAREDAREDWQDHREDLAEERGDRAKNSQEQRTDRQQNRQENRPEATQAQRDQARAKAQSSVEARSSSGTTGAARERSTAERSGTSSNAFSGYSSGQSTRAASSRGQQSRSSSSRSRSGGGRRR
jgi:hypothetical protein